MGSATLAMEMMNGGAVELAALAALTLLLRGLAAQKLLDLQNE